MSNNQSVQKQTLSIAKNASRAIFFAALLFVAYGISDYIRWMNNTSVDPMETSEESEVKGAQNCQSLENVDFWIDISGNRSWFLLGDEFSQDSQTLTVTASVDTNLVLEPRSLIVSYTIAENGQSGSFIPQEANTSYSASIDTSTLESGTYTLSVKAENSCSEKMSDETISFNVSYPVYVVWSIDWEGSDVKQQYLDEMNTIANTYGVPMTHFFNPRIFLSSVVPENRADYLVQYVLSGKETRGDAIGLHLHMFPDMVSAAGVTPSYSPAWGWTRTDGYDIMVSGYSYDKMDAVLDWSVGQFESHGLGTPIMFRAGGWFADEGTLRVLEDNGFALDSSGRTSYSLGTNNVLTHWNLLETTQPYHPSYSDQNSAGNPGMELWEFPNNGGDSWSFSQNDMYGRYRANYPGGNADSVKIITFLSHPDWFYEDKPKMEGLFSTIGNDLYASDKGPVIFTTLEYLYQNMAEVE